MKTLTKPSSRFDLFGAMLLVAAIVSILIPATAQAQWFPQNPPVTNAIPATTTNTVNVALIDASQTEEFALQISGKLTGAGTSAVSYSVENSVDGTNYVAVFFIPITAAGTTTVTARTNVNAQSYPFWRISTVGNANATTWTNGVVTVGIKRSVAKYRTW